MKAFTTIHGTTGRPQAPSPLPLDNTATTHTHTHNDAGRRTQPEPVHGHLCHGREVQEPEPGRQEGQIQGSPVGFERGVEAAQPAPGGGEDPPSRPAAQRQNNLLLPGGASLFEAYKNLLRHHRVANKLQEPAQPDQVLRQGVLRNRPLDACRR